MSEYQYYEFVAVDRPLTEEELEEVRSLSTRAQITSTTFTNSYEWGDFRGDPQRLVERYYDAHLYLANWGTRQVMLRLPKTHLAPSLVELYCIDEFVESWTTDTHLVLNLRSEDEGADWEEGAEDSLAVISGVRAELAAGDHRALYLAWLSAVYVWEPLDDEDQVVMEPPVPAGLDRLTGPQRALADFLRVDRDLLAVAAEASPSSSLIPAVPGKSELTHLITALPERQKIDFLLRLALGREPQLGAELVRHLRGEPRPLVVPGQRSAAQLLDAAQARAAGRRSHR